jgi:ribonuclease P protein component
VIGRIVRSVDFERVLAAPTRARSAHFAVHHLDGGPSLAGPRSIHKLSTELSTGLPTPVTALVDDVQQGGAAAHGCWLGAVVPKRHAKRSVTRTLLKRQIRAAVGAQAHLPAGLWVIRLRAPFAPLQFPSAASTALRQAARVELDGVLGDAVRRLVRR